MDQRPDQQEPDGSRRPVSLEQIRESERSAPSPEGTSSAGRTANAPPLPTPSDGSPGWMANPVDQGLGERGGHDAIEASDLPRDRAPKQPGRDGPR
jgi:hypothetical protein